MPFSKRLSNLSRTIVLIVAAAAIIALLCVFCIYYYRHDPSSGGIPCLFKYITGYDCPGCGSQRAFHSLLHGRVGDAWSYNPFIFFAIPLAAFYFYAESMRRIHPKLHLRANHPIVLGALFFAIILYWILRNI